MEISIHDNIIYSYLVMCEDFSRRFYEMIFYTEYYQSSEKPEFTDVVFSGVIAHHFEQEAAQTVIFGIEERNLEESYNQNVELFSRLKNYSWPMRYKDKVELFESLKGKKIKSFEIQSSCGLTGWVWAKEMKLVKREKRQIFL